jgi:integrase
MNDQINKGNYMEPSTETVKDFLERWVRDSVQNKQRATTVLNYRLLMDVHVIPEIGGLPLAKLQPMHIQQLYRKKLESGRVDGSGGLSPTTVRRIHAVLHKALSTAVKWQFLPRNPADAVDAPKPADTQMKFMTPEQVGVFLAASGNETFSTLYLTAIMTGLRRGELLGLRWEDVNLDSGQLAVRRSLVQMIDGTIAYQDPKTAHGERTVALPNTVIVSLREHRQKQDTDRSKLGSAYQENDLIFANSLGGPIRPDNLRRNFKETLKKAGLPEIRFHDLRHTHATLMLSQGVHPKIVSERLGHSSVQITLDTYSHALPNLQAEAADKLDKALFGDERNRSRN